MHGRLKCLTAVSSEKVRPGVGIYSSLKEEAKNKSKNVPSVLQHPEILSTSMHTAAADVVA